VEDTLTVMGKHIETKEEVVTAKFVFDINKLESGD
jgi:hypothetical protein